jgi:hypothetical protein
MLAASKKDWGQEKHITHLVYYAVGINVFLRGYILGFGCGKMSLVLCFPH